MSTPEPAAAGNHVPEGERLLAAHRALDALFEDLANRAESGEWSLCDAIWDEFSRTLEAHMVLEESELFPAFLARHPEQSDTIAKLTAEHAALRKLLVDLGVSVQLHVLRENDVKAMLDQLKAHAAAENATVYPFASRAEGNKEPS